MGTPGTSSPEHELPSLPPKPESHKNILWQPAPNWLVGISVVFVLAIAIFVRGCGKTEQIDVSSMGYVTADEVNTIVANAVAKAKQELKDELKAELAPPPASTPEVTSKETPGETMTQAPAVAPITQQPSVAAADSGKAKKPELPTLF